MKIATRNKNARNSLNYGHLRRFAIDFKRTKTPPRGRYLGERCEELSTLLRRCADLASETGAGSMQEASRIMEGG